MATLSEEHIQKVLRWTGWSFRVRSPDSQFYAPRLLQRLTNIDDSVVTEAEYIIQQIINIELQLTDSLKRVKASSVGGEVALNSQEIMQLKSEKRRLIRELTHYLDLFGPFEQK